MGDRSPIMVYNSKYKILGISVRPLTYRRWLQFKSNRRAYCSLWIFSFIFITSLFSSWIANDSPLAIHLKGKWYFPVIFQYTETDFGGEFETEANYKDSYIQSLIEINGGTIYWPLIPFSYDTIIQDLDTPSPAPPSSKHWLGTDGYGRDVTARLIYSIRFSLVFGLVSTLLCSTLGIAIGAIQGFFGGWVDLIGQRLVEIWQGLPELFILLILASVVTPNFWWLLLIFLLFRWIALEGVVRAEFLRARQLDYVRAARALGASAWYIVPKHVLPNAMIAALTFIPFVIGGSITLLAVLDLLGLGMPAGTASLGEMLYQGKTQLYAPWLGITAFSALTIVLCLLVFIGEGVRDALDPRRV